MDFETADAGYDSACAIGLVRVAGDAIVDRAYQLLRPPRRDFTFTHIHGITWDMVRGAPTFGQAWRSLEKMLAGAAFVAAHNVGFDRSVLAACCRSAALPMPDVWFHCSMRIARYVLKIQPTNLGNVCRQLGIPLQHHHALSDAEACARIILTARRLTPSAVSR